MTRMAIFEELIAEGEASPHVVSPSPTSSPLTLKGPGRQPPSSAASLPGRRPRGSTKKASRISDASTVHGVRVRR
jgi:hypothetical protein